MNLYSYQFERVPWPVVVEHLPNQPWLEDKKKHPTVNKHKMKLSTKYNTFSGYELTGNQRKSASQLAKSQVIKVTHT